MWPERVSVSCPVVGTPLPPASGRRPLPTGLPSWGFAECSQTPLLWSPEPLAAGEGRRRPWHSLRGAEGRAPGTGCGCGRTLGLPTMAPSPALQPRLPCPPVSAGRHPRPCVIGGPRPFAGQSPRASATCSEARPGSPSHRPARRPCPPPHCAVSSAPRATPSLADDHAHLRAGTFSATPRLRPPVSSCVVGRFCIFIYSLVSWPCGF